MLDMKLVVPFFLVAISTQAQNSIIGKWKTVDDDTGEVKSVVEIYERNGRFYGKIVKVFIDGNTDPVCEKCSEEDDRYQEKIIGMEIIRHMLKSGAEYEAGDILDPEDGRIYRCKLWVEGDDLKVRGYWGPFYRTQTWRKST